ncbi:MAG: hypothetical protein ACOCVC_06755 [Spirochaeta sp.]
MPDVHETGFLNVLADFSFPENRIVINPNDGLDLGLMTTETVVELVYGQNPATYRDGEGYSLHGIVDQQNKCRIGTVEVSLKAVARMGKPKRVRLHLMPRDRYPKLLLDAE